MDTGFSGILRPGGHSKGYELLKLGACKGKAAYTAGLTKPTNIAHSTNEKIQSNTLDANYYSFCCSLEINIMKC